MFRMVIAMLFCLATTFIAALRYDCLTTPMVVDDTINGELFLAYVEQELVILLPVENSPH